MTTREPVETIPMFPEPPRVVRERQRSYLRSVAWGNCPKCRIGRVGVLRSGQHLVWREHAYTTWSGHRMTCTASGAAVCACPERKPTITAGGVECPHASTEALMGGGSR